MLRNSAVRGEGSEDTGEEQQLPHVIHQAIRSVLCSISRLSPPSAAWMAIILVRYLLLDRCHLVVMMSRLLAP